MPPEKLRELQAPPPLERDNEDLAGGGEVRNNYSPRACWLESPALSGPLPAAGLLRQAGGPRAGCAEHWSQSHRV